MLNAKRIVIGIAALALATGSMGMANGDALRTRDQLRDDSCLTAQDQIRDRIQDCDEICVPIGDGVPDQIRLHLHETV
jgi:hypothetical protein